jgi:ABC-type lipoprotein export system ATPase subunit
MNENREWGCELNAILVTRSRSGGGGFRLHVPELRMMCLPMNGFGYVPIMGISGAGKSTLMNLMAGIEWPREQGGQVRWTFPDGNSFAWGVEGPSPEQTLRLRRDYFGFAFQNSTLIPHLTISENLCYPLEMQGFSRSAARAKAAEKLEHLIGGDVKDFMRRYPGHLSGGEMQRIALIQSMIHDPNVLFADEPTGSLDQQTRMTVMGALRQWVSEDSARRLLVWVTHHERDPQDNGVFHRLHVSDGQSTWQTWNTAQEDWMDDGCNI